MKPEESGFARLIQFLIELSQQKAYCQVTLTVQKGQIERVHVDRSFTLAELPVKSSRN